MLSALETEHLGQGETSLRLSVEIVRATRERDGFSSDGFRSGELTAPGMDDRADWAPQHVRVEVVGGGMLLGDGGPVERLIELPDFDECLREEARGAREPVEVSRSFQLAAELAQRRSTAAAGRPASSSILAREGSV